MVLKGCGITGGSNIGNNVSKISVLSNKNTFTYANFFCLTFKCKKMCWQLPVLISIDFKLLKPYKVTIIYQISSNLK